MLDSGWAAKEVEGARLVDARFRRVMAQILEAKGADSGASFSAVCGNALRQAAGRFLRHEQTKDEDLLAGHQQATLDRCLGKRTIVVAQDTSSYNYSTHRATTGLGPLNDSAKAAGIHQHSALAMTPQRLPLGVVDVYFWARSQQELDEEKAAKSKKAADKRPIEDKESFRWIRTKRHIEQLFTPYVQAGGEVVIVADREADIFDFLADERIPGVELVIRAAQPRRVQVCGQDERYSLLEAAQKGRRLGEYTVQVTGPTRAQDREAKMELASCTIDVLPPTDRKDYTGGPVTLTVVEACEVTPEGFTETPLHWVMITTLDASDFELARRVIDLYTCRWEIERFHFTLKSGCQAERLQMDDYATLCNTLALYLIVAWRLLYITHLARVEPDMPAGEIIDESELAILNQKSRVPVTTVGQAILAIAKLAGFEPYKNGPPPGVKSLWIGLRKLEDMAAGWRLAMSSIRRRDVNQA